MPRPCGPHNSVGALSADPALLGSLDLVTSEDLDRIAGWLRDANYVAALTGAGLSTESGIPDFRGPNGVWTKNPDAEKAAQISNYLADSELRKRNWASRTKNEIFRAAPNPGHEALVALERRDALHAIVTQNVDGLHHAAGQDPGIVVEIHGNVREAKCLDCGWRGPMEETLDRVRNGEADPVCFVCGGILKSATISFGENLVPDDLRRSQLMAGRADVFLAIGTSLVVYPAAALPGIAVQNGARLVILNAEETPYDEVADAVVRDPLGEVLPALAARL